MPLWGVGNRTGLEIAFPVFLPRFLYLLLAAILLPEWGSLKQLEPGPLCQGEIERS